MFNFWRRSLVLLALIGNLGIGTLAYAEVAILGTPMATATIRVWGNAYEAESDIDVSYVEALEEVSSVELFAGLYDLAMVEFPFAEYRLKQHGLVQFPLLGAGVVVVANVPGVAPGSLHLNAAVLAAIYMGKVTHWDDAKIAELNHGLALPHLKIVPVAQSDGSVVTFNFTRYLAGGSAAWRQQVGLGSGQIWPLGKGEKDAGAAAANVQSTSGAVGFLPWGHVQKFNLAPVLLQNAQGQFIKPDADVFAKTFRAFLAQPTDDLAAPVNMKGAQVWPVMAVIYGQMKQIPEDVPDAMKTVQMLTQVLQRHVPAAPGFIAVSYGDVSQALGRVQTSKDFGPPTRKGGS